jgi:hypothetical protein
MKRLSVVANLVRRLVSTLLLFVAYIAGIGVASLLGKLVGKSFLSLAPKRSSWSYFPKHLNQHTMY